MTNDKLETIIKGLQKLRHPAIVETLLLLHETKEIISMTTEDLLLRLIDDELEQRKNNTITRLLSKAHLSQKNARLENLDLSPERQINFAVLEQISDDQYILNHRNIVLMGACGVGKSFVANALAAKACEHLHKTLYVRMFELLEECNLERLELNDSNQAIRKYAKPEVLVIDDFLNRKLSTNEANDIFKIMELRNGIKTTIISTQLEPKEWHVQSGGNILADSILDRILPSAYKLILSGPSRRGL